jgi:Fur family ferric uptake transcriptional regulator
VSAPRASRPLHASSVASAVNVLHARGLRVSAARRQVLETLYAADRPLTAEEIAGQHDVGSVYRNLDVLEQVGLVRHVHLGHGPGRYAPAAREYALCERCGAVRALDEGDLDAVRSAVVDALSFLPRFSHFPLAGVCSACLLREGRNEF